MIQKLLVILLLFFHITAFSQKEENSAILEKDSTWGSEFFAFPIDFAPEIAYQGREEAIFPPNWAKKDSSEFWSYAFAWQINLNKKLTKSKLETNLQFYFDGLMHSVHGNPETNLPKTTARFSSKKRSDNKNVYIGEVVIFDTFFTKKPLTLHAIVEQYSCIEEEKSVLIFRFSPKGFEHEVWRKLDEVKIRTGVCRD
ncbi:MAG: hypothetical protein K0R65_2396 [Crocinitomicaceae bacterium]|jgi:hypothetical protein|nr:hypothetical protein [Crocinitomicaceae bacterium]